MQPAAHAAPRIEHTQALPSHRLGPSKYQSKIRLWTSWISGNRCHSSPNARSVRIESEATAEPPVGCSAGNLSRSRDAQQRALLPTRVAVVVECPRSREQHAPTTAAKRPIAFRVNAGVDGQRVATLGTPECRPEARSQEERSRRRGPGLCRSCLPLDTSPRARACPILTVSVTHLLRATTGAAWAGLKTLSSPRGRRAAGGQRSARVSGGRKDPLSLRAVLRLRRVSVVDHRIGT